MARRYDPDDYNDLDRADDDQRFAFENESNPRPRKARPIARPVLTLCPYCLEPVNPGGTFCVKCENYVGPPEPPRPSYEPMWGWMCVALTAGAGLWWVVTG